MGSNNTPNRFYNSVFSRHNVANATTASMSVDEGRSLVLQWELVGGEGALERIIESDGELWPHCKVVSDYNPVRLICTLCINTCRAHAHPTQDKRGQGLLG